MASCSLSEENGAMSQKETENLERVLLFRKELNGNEVFCSVRAFPDGSAYVEGDEIEMIFEESADALNDAITHLEKLGYAKA
jgi:hypothetical protein